jgi:hypothetical protein
MTFGAESQMFGQVPPRIGSFTDALLQALRRASRRRGPVTPSPFGAAFADVAKPSHPVTVKTPRPTHSAPTKTDESHGKQLSLSVSVNPELPPRAGIL